MFQAERIAVVVGIGEVVDRTRDPASAREPTALIAAALHAAAADAGAGWLARLDSIELVALTSWRYANPVGDVCARLGISPARAIHTRRGGETPVRLLHEASLRVIRGESKACAIIGGEATSSRVRARHSGVELSWTPMCKPEEAAHFAGDSTVRSVLAERYDMLEPSRIYPLYETASQAAWNQTAAEAHAESARLWARFAEAARTNPCAWNRDAPAAKEIGAISPDNRLINWPYPKLMVANPSVNQAAAFIVTTLAEARRAGIAEERMIYVLGGAAANEPDDFLHRDRYDRSTAQEAVLRQVVEIAGGIESVPLLELYSCFPIVPKLAIRSLGIDPERVMPSVTGGLSFFGGPLHNYMSHATCAMVTALRKQRSATGLLYGQGGYVTKHHALLLGTQAPRQALPENYSVQSIADTARGVSPRVLDDYTGSAVLEAFTVHYSREGTPLQGVVVLRTPAGDRTMARVPADDGATLAQLQTWGRNPIGSDGVVVLGANGAAGWKPLIRAPASSSGTGP